MKAESLKRWFLSGKERSDIGTALFVLFAVSVSRYLAKYFHEVFRLSYAVTFAAGFAVACFASTLLWGSGRLTRKASFALITAISLLIYVLCRRWGV